MRHRFRVSVPGRRRCRRRLSGISLGIAADSQKQRNPAVVHDSIQERAVQLQPQDIRVRHRRGASGQHHLCECRSLHSVFIYAHMRLLPDLGDKHLPVSHGGKIRLQAKRGHHPQLFQQGNQFHTVPEREFRQLQLHFPGVRFRPGKDLLQFFFREQIPDIRPLFRQDQHHAPCIFQTQTGSHVSLSHQPGQEIIFLVHIDRVRLSPRKGGEGAFRVPVLRKFHRPLILKPDRIQYRQYNFFHILPFRSQRSSCVFRQPFAHGLSRTSVREIHPEQVRVEILLGGADKILFKLALFLHPQRIRQHQPSGLIFPVQQTEQFSTGVGQFLLLIHSQQLQKLCLCGAGSPLRCQRQRVIKRQRRIVPVLLRISQKRRRRLPGKLLYRFLKTFRCLVFLLPGKLCFGILPGDALRQFHLCKTFVSAAGCPPLLRSASAQHKRRCQGRRQSRRRAFFP